jgi:uncharacterized membrane protein YkoI
MRRIVPILLVWGLSSAALAQGEPAALDCVPERQIQQVVASQKVVAPARALVAARQQLPNAEMVRANLCRSDDALVYVIMALRKDGRVVQVTIDGLSGRVKSVQ